MFPKFNGGPAIIITAAFIGPGTITLCVLAGVKNGFSLLWAMLLSIFITIFIQNTTARISYTTRKGLAESLLLQTSNPFFKLLLALLLISAIFIGNAAYEAGNLTGALIGFQSIISDVNFHFGTRFDFLPVFIGILVAGLILLGSNKLLKNVLVSIVLLMSVSFFITALLTKPNLQDLFYGLFMPTFNSKDTLTIVGLLGTTVVPYNLFLHAALVKDEYFSLESLRWDTIFAVGLGGLVSLCIIISAAALQGQPVESASDLGLALAPLYGNFATTLMSVGLFAAGITSAITAPMAAAFVVCECFGWRINSVGYKTVALLVLATGVVLCSLQIRPIEVVRFAQITNGILLPVVGLFLVLLINNSRLMQGKTASVISNIILFAIEFFFLFLGVKSLGLIF
jgi:Mn2+/Fe2+ NRAMP family transporter|tara:strand:+ start:1700 stop:2893 length:1194 start_codon:yes stop_codon:yes gene_type:complete